MEGRLQIMTRRDVDTIDTRLPVSLLTGFLGSGKTTVLNYLVRHTFLKRTLVIINEFGAIGLDHDLITHSEEDIVVEMSSGCMCCTIRGDLVRTLHDALDRAARDEKAEFDRVVIETTGLADPAPILHTLMSDERIAGAYRLDGVITTVDAATGMTTLDRQEESVKQAAVADRLLLTKSDLVDGGTVEALKQRLKDLNPGAPVLTTLNGEVDPARILDAGLYNPATKTLDVQRWLNAEAAADEDEQEHEHEDHEHEEGHHHGDGHADAHGHAHGETHHGHHGHHDHDHDVNRHDEHIRATCLTLDDPIPRESFDRWFEALLLLKGPDILRVKGILNIEGQNGPEVIHGVQHIFHPPLTLNAWPSDDRRSRLVFIARDLDESALRDTFEIFLHAPPVEGFAEETRDPIPPADGEEAVDGEEDGPSLTLTPVESDGQAFVLFEVTQ